MPTHTNPMWLCGTVEQSSYLAGKSIINFPNMRYFIAGLNNTWFHFRMILAVT